MPNNLSKKSKAKKPTKSIITVLVISTLVLFVLVLTMRDMRGQLQILRDESKNLNITNYTTSSANSISATISGLNEFSNIHNSAQDLGWHLVARNFDSAGNPVYIYEKNVSHFKLKLTIAQSIHSLNDRSTEVTISISST